MFVSGFTIARNVVKGDYPITEAITSVLPLCDEFIVSVGQSDDGTSELIKKINDSRIKIVHSTWDNQLRTGGQVLAIETNKAKSLISKEADWCFYIQADECIHESEYVNIRNAMHLFKDDREIEGLLFDYYHFYGSYNYVANSRNWYRKEIRVIRNLPEIESYKDAQGFRLNNRKLNVRAVNAHIFHYGWVKHPDKQLSKLKEARKYWHSDTFLEKEYKNQPTFDFSKVDLLTEFKGTHPSVMEKRISAKDWNFEHPLGKKRMGFRQMLLHTIEKWTGIRIGENRNYKIKS